VPIQETTARYTSGKFYWQKAEKQKAEGVSSAFALSAFCLLLFSFIRAFVAKTTSHIALAKKLYLCSSTN